MTRSVFYSLDNTSFRRAVGAPPFAFSLTGEFAVAGAQLLLDDGAAERTLTVPSTTALVLLAGGTAEFVFDEAQDAVVTVQLDSGATETYALTAAQVDDDAVNLELPTITGTGAEGQTLTATPGLWLVDGALNLSASYQWLRGGVAISGATGATYTVAAADAGASLSVRETVGTQSATSAAVAITSSLYSFTDTFDQHANDTRLKDLAEWDPVYTNNGDIKVVSGEAGMFANADQIIRFVPTLAQKRYIEADMANAVQGAFNTALALFPRYADSSNRIGLAIQANFAVTQTSGGTFSTLYSDPVAMAAGAVVRVEVDGGTVRYVRDGVLKWTGTTTVLTGQPAMKAQSAAWPIDHNRIGSIKIGELA